MDMTTTTRVGTVIAPGQTLTAANSALLAQLITSVSAAAERVLDRVVLVGSQTEYLNIEPGQTVFRLRAWPVSSVTSVHFDVDNAWGAGTEIAASDYVAPAYSTAGLLRMRYALAPESSSYVYQAALKVVYTGGMAATTAAFIAAFPDISEAIDAQVAHQYHARNVLGAGSVGGDGGNMTPSQVAWLPRTLEILHSHRSLSL